MGTANRDPLLAFGTDHPFAIADPAVNIAATFPEVDARLVFSENARLMFGLPTPVERS